jgi:hypothetical protein
MKTNKVLLAFGVFLVVAGVVGWASTGFTSRGKTAIVMGSATGTIMLLCGVAAGSVKWRTLGERVGLGFAVMFGGVFVWRAVMAWLQVAEGLPKVPVAVLLSTMSAVALGVAAWLAGKGLRRA